MKLYIKQKVFSFKDKFTVKDEQGADKYFVEGKILSIGKKLRVYDAQENELAYIHQKIVSFLPKFTVEINGEEVAEIVQKISLLKAKYSVKGPGWEVEGDLLDHNYKITDASRTVVSIHKKWMAWGDTYELDIAQGGDEIMALAVVLAIDAVIDEQAAVTAANT